MYYFKGPDDTETDYDSNVFLFLEYEKKIFKLCSVSAVNSGSLITDCNHISPNVLRHTCPIPSLF